MRQETRQKLVYLICFSVVATAVVGYFVGLQSPMNPMAKTENHDQEIENHSQAIDHEQAKTDVLPATHYSQMNDAAKARKANYRTSLVDLKRNFDPLAEVTITDAQKTFALSLRSKNRAFNGAPPTIPHGIEQMSAESCMACHGEGFKTESLRISKMSHQFLANCTQCHVENNPSHIPAAKFRENTFVGLPAPTGGPRAYDGAPPMIPHSTWMRVNCMSCHGFSSQHGIRTTHPWRQNCQQCHAPSSKLDQVILPSKPNFLSPLKVNDKKNYP